MPDAVRLVLPSKRYAAQYYEVQAEIQANGESPSFGMGFRHTDFGDVQKEIEDYANGINLPPDEVRRKVLFLIREEDDRLLGATNIRGLDNEFFITVGGNIGYSVRPSERRKGYATRMLALALDECRKLGFARVLVTCEPGNAASTRVIMKNGGVLDGEAKDRDDITYLRFWIDLKDRCPGR